MSRATNDLSNVRMLLGPGIMYSLNTVVTVAEHEGDPPEKVSFKERMEIIASLPDMLADLHQYKIECQRPPPAKRDAGKQDRNALCSCGSGKKYKHCHGAAN